MRPDPFILGQGIDELLEAEEVRREGQEGLPQFYMPGDFDPGRRADRDRKAYILRLYREFIRLVGGGLVGDALERVVYEAAVRAGPGKFTVWGSPDRPIAPGTMISGKPVQREPDLILVGCGKSDCVADIEAKNLREWLSASSREVWSLIGRALRIDAVPVLIARKILFPAYYVFRRIGLLAYQMHFQFFPPEMEATVAEIKHKDGLGFSDIRCSHEPPATLIRYFAEHLPRLAVPALQRFLEHKEMLSGYAIHDGLEGDLPGPRRSELFREFERELFGWDFEPPEVDYEVEDYY